MVVNSSLVSVILALSMLWFCGELRLVGWRGWCGFVRPAALTWQQGDPHSVAQTRNERTIRMRQLNRWPWVGWGLWRWSSRIWLLIQIAEHEFKYVYIMKM